MNKTAKYTIIALVIAVVIYIAYRFFKNPKPVSEVVKQPTQTTGNAKAVVETTGSACGAAIIDIKSGGYSVGNLTNGLAPDPVAPSTVTAPKQQITNSPKLGPVVLDPNTQQPKVSDLSNGLNADIPILNLQPPTP
jgi:hypothetical protein